MTPAYPIAVVFTGLACGATMVFSSLLSRRLPRDGALFKALFARRRRSVGRRRFWLRARYCLPWVASPDLAGCPALVRKYLAAARASATLFVTGALAVLASLGHAALLLATQ
jgi:hypothetical protein